MNELQRRIIQIITAWSDGDEELEGRLPLEVLADETSYLPRLDPP